jgi:hypothetical protein
VPGYVWEFDPSRSEDLPNVDPEEVKSIAEVTAIGQ